MDKNTLLNTLLVWNSYLKRKVHLIACGGTAITLMNLKESTKDIDLIVPEENEYRYLTKVLIDLGYEMKTGTGWQKEKGFIFDLYVGKTIFTTQLLESPLKAGNNVPYKEFSFIYLGILNDYDLLITKLFRYSSVDRDDCLALYRTRNLEIHIEELNKRFFETSSYDVSDEKNRKNFRHFLGLLEKEGFEV